MAGNLQISCRKSGKWHVKADYYDVENK